MWQIKKPWTLRFRPPPLRQHKAHASLLPVRQRVCHDISSFMRDQISYLKDTTARPFKESKSLKITRSRSVQTGFVRDSCKWLLSHFLWQRQGAAFIKQWAGFIYCVSGGMLTAAGSVLIFLTVTCAHCLLTGWSVLDLPIVLLNTAPTDTKL